MPYQELGSWIFGLSLLAIYLVIIPGVYVYLNFLLVRFAWNYFAVTRYKLLATSVTLIAALWFPILGPLKSYIAYTYLAKDYGKPQIYKSISNVDKLFIEGSCHIAEELAFSRIYEGIETMRDYHCGYSSIQSGGILQYLEVDYQQSIDHHLMWVEKNKPDSHYIVKIKIRDYDGSIQIRTLEISTDTGELLGKYDTLMLTVGGLLAYFSPKDPIYYSTRTSTSISEIDFIKKVLPPPRAVPAATTQ